MFQVQVHRLIKQIENGRHYVGYIEMGGVRFCYEIVFVVSIIRLADMPPPENPTQMKRFFSLTLWKGEYGYIDVSDAELEVFATLAQLAVDFYYNPTVRAENRAHCKEEIFGEDNVVYSLFDELREVLTSEKFGCDFTA